ncbi:MAG: hypothetical protein ACKO9D_01840 [Gammaproteobacteria bacterium]
MTSLVPFRSERTPGLSGLSPAGRVESDPAAVALWSSLAAAGQLAAVSEAAATEVAVAEVA